MKHLTATASALILAAATAGVASADGHKEGHMDGAKHGAHMSQSSDMQDMSKTTKTYSSDKTAAGSADFAAMDASKDGQVDFTEFSNYLESAYGYDASSAAQEYVRLTGGQDTLLTDESFAGVSFKRLDHKHMDGTMHKGTMGQMSTQGSMQSAGSTMSTSQNTAVLGATATSFDYGDFSGYDSNADGQVDFNEYRQYRSKAGISNTKAAQEFIRFSNGNAMFTQSDFDTARSMGALERNYYRSN